MKSLVLIGAFLFLAVKAYQNLNAGHYGWMVLCILGIIAIFIYAVIREIQKNQPASPLMIFCYQMPFDTVKTYETAVQIQTVTNLNDIDTIERLSWFGDAALATGADINQIGYAYLQTKMRGETGKQEVMQFHNMGIPLGVNEDIDDFFRKFCSIDGPFYGLLANAMQRNRYI